MRNRRAMFSRSLGLVAVLFLVSFATASLVASAQEAVPSATSDGQELRVPPQIVIDIPPPGIGFNEEGDLLLVATLTNIGTTTSQPMDLIAIVLTDCIIGEIPQTCRFAAFGSFEGVTPDGIARAVPSRGRSTSVRTHRSTSAVGL